MACCVEEMGTWRGAQRSLCEQDDGTVDNHGRCDTQQQHRFSGSPHMYMLSVLTQGAHQTVQSATAARIPAPGRPATTSTGLGLRLMVLRGSKKTRLGISRAINAWHRGHVNRNAARSVESSCQTPAYCHLCRHFYHSKNYRKLIANETSTLLRVVPSRKTMTRQPIYTLQRKRENGST